MQNLLIILLLIFPSIYSHATSAVRAPGESFQSARNNALMASPFSILNLDEDEDTPLSNKIPLPELDISEAPELGSYDDLLDLFTFVRDRKGIYDAETEMLRRLTWLYPDDGCFVRAEMARWYADDESWPEPAKVFAFGELRAETVNSLEGYVQWWYHVAISYRVGDVLYVIDPAIEPTRPLTLEEWNNAMALDDPNIEFSLCSARTYVPRSNCNEPEGLERANAVERQSSYFQYEWERLIYLNRDPIEELQDNPPWLNQSPPAPLPLP